MLAAWVVDGECGVGLDVVWETRKDDRGDGTVFFGRSGRDSEDIVARWLMQETKKRDWDKMARWMDAGCEEKDSRVDVRYYPATPSRHQQVKQINNATTIPPKRRRWHRSFSLVGTYTVHALALRIYLHICTSLCYAATPSSPSPPPPSPPRPRSAHSRPPCPQSSSGREDPSGRAWPCPRPSPSTAW